jgi:hypothetical protein
VVFVGAAAGRGGSVLLSVAAGSREVNTIKHDATDPSLGPNARYGV